MAGLWKLPVIYFIENNHYGMGTSVARASAQTRLHAKFRGIPGVKIDGMDVFAVREHLRIAKDYVLKNGPMFFEVETYRYHGHSMSDPGITYRKRDEVAQIRESRDCIARVRNLILDHSIAVEAEVKEIEKSVKHQIEKDVEQAKQDAFPEIKDMYTNIYHGNEEHYIRGVDYQSSVFPSNK
jgi:pyruvate dehydrogenase E1 component alpha subunit